MEKEKKRNTMEDPLHDADQKRRFHKRRRPSNDQNDGGVELAAMFREGKRYKRRELTKQEQREHRERDEYIARSRREKEVQRKLERGHIESGSDSVEEENQKKERKSTAKKRITEVKTLRRKKEWTQNCMERRPGKDEDENKNKKRIKEEEEEEDLEHPIHQEKKDDVSSRVALPGISEKTLPHFNNSKEEQDAEKNLPLPLQKLFYVEQQEEAPNVLDHRDDGLSPNNRLLENALHSLEYTDTDMSMVMDVMIQQGKTMDVGSRRDLWEKVIASMDVITRREDDHFLRTKKEGERDCCNGDACQGRKIYGEGNILVEHLDEKSLRDLHETGTLPEVGHLCLMCKRYVVAYMYINARAECGSIPGDSLICAFYNLIGAGEYALEQCIMSGTTEYQGLPAPVVLHCRRYYRKEVREDAIYYVQQGYMRPEETTREKEEQVF